MQHTSISLNELYQVEGGVLTTYAVDYPFDQPDQPWRRPAVIVVPGGGYAMCSKREGEVVALAFLARGFHAFVLDYTCDPERVHYPAQLLELAAAVDYVRKNADALRVNPDEIFAVGFSAGGHLVASLSTDYTIAQAAYDGELAPQLAAAGLIYPVISDKVLYGHAMSHENLFQCADEAFRERNLPLTRMDERVCGNTAPAYVFSTAEDECVPPMHALSYASALAQHGVPFELHVYKNGGHGMSLADNEIAFDNTAFRRNRAWVDDCAAFFRTYVSETY